MMNWPQSMGIDVQVQNEVTSMVNSTPEFRKAGLNTYAKYEMLGFAGIIPPHGKRMISNSMPPPNELIYDINDVAVID